jgi:SNF2 family DNA or RNA helicase
VPASLRTQWRAELAEKFYIDSSILESKNYNKAKEEGSLNPFDIRDQVVICSFNFASLKENDFHAMPWDLVIIDEAHRLRNVYKSGNVTGTKLRRALAGKKKLLLTATPLQNNLMELYGLVSIIDEHVFGDARTFRDMYVSVFNEEIRIRSLKARLAAFCKRTLRKQVTEYVNYTSCIAILQKYTPTADEEKLYNFISEYLQSDRLFALPQGQRTLITLVLRKLLASSSFAISGTLNSLIERLQLLMKGLDTQLEFNDYDTFDELSDEREDGEDPLTAGLEQDRAAVAEELHKLTEYADLAKSITNNVKGDNLLTALQQGFDETESRGGERKAVIFTESRRTQEYLLHLLSDNGYDGQIVFLNGSNNDDISKRINLQFCSLIVNYDLPWNPRRIEQRIGRCHRYGQKNDVVVINFLNKKNAADVRVYELQEELSERINEKLSVARQSILENFDKEVAARLKGCQQDTLAGLDKFSRWLCDFFIMRGAERVKPLWPVAFLLSCKLR